jgi:deazaflavin-dependent oxidoreductase (nitroreductase family)
MICEFSTNAGRVGGRWEGYPLLLLRHTDLKSGVTRVNPVAYVRDAGRYLIFAAIGEHHTAGWYHNLKAQPHSRVELGARRSMSSSPRP